MKFLIVIFILISLSLHARIGETKAQCLKRYGMPIVNDKECLGFQKSGFLIMAFLINNKCECIIYYKLKNKNDLDEMLDISDNELAHFMKINNPSGLKLTSSKNDKLFTETWVAPNKALAVQRVKTIAPKVIIMTKKYVVWSALETRIEEDKVLKGF